MQRFRVKSLHFDYPVVAGRGAWGEFRRFESSRYSSIFVLTERRLWRLWSREFLRSSGLKSAKEIFAPPGESSKSLAQTEKVVSAMIKGGADRHSLLVIFGGGVMGDLGGFIASTYMRGIDSVQVPTTVVAQVDSAIGGKTAVNAGGIKNLVGTFSPPRLMLSDPRVLSTLDRRVFRSGFYEMAKHAIIAGGTLFGRMEKEIGTLKPGDTERLEPLLAVAARVKVDVVNRDERESSLRRVLNLGHTFGHALEEATGYRRFLHGEAVGWGMLGSAQMGVLLGMLRESDGKRIAGLVRSIGPLPPIQDISPDRILRLLPRDKKAVAGEIHWIVPERIGKVNIVPGVSPKTVAESLRGIQRNL